MRTPFRANRSLILGLAICLLPIWTIPATAQEGNVCIECHGTLPGRLGKPVMQWKKSVHAENGITCNSCHGGDPRDLANAMSPGRGFIGVPKEQNIPSFCGRCHVGIKGDYLQSGHGKALGRGGPTCITCHGNHLVLKASLDIIDEKLCGVCHSYERARLLKEAMQQTESAISRISQRLERFKHEGVDTDPLDKALFAARNHYRSLFHEVNTAKVTAESQQIAQELGKLGHQLDAMDADRSRRKVVGAIAVGGALLTALLAYLLKKSYD